MVPERQHADAPLTSVAYFSMEFMLSEALPIYSGGLGNVAGDQLKAASDLGVPVIGVGLLYQQGYFRQVLDAQGGQRRSTRTTTRANCRSRRCAMPDGEWVRLEIALPGYKVWVRAWQAQVGRATLYLLDSNDPANPPAVRGITSELYGGGPELRLQQEIVLGIGGWRLLRALGLQPEVCHLNEGHAAFAVLERARCFMEDHGQPFDVALAVTRAGNLFTTHTPVEAGFDRFRSGPDRTVPRGYAAQSPGHQRQRAAGAGPANPDDAHEPFNMAYLAMRGSGAVNGVSRLHGEVSRQLVPAALSALARGMRCRWGTSPTGCTCPPGTSAAADELWSQAVWAGPLARRHGRGVDSRTSARVSDAALWELRNTARQRPRPLRARAARPATRHRAAAPMAKSSRRSRCSTPRC